MTRVVVRSARLRDAPGLLAVLWAFTRATPWLPVVRSRRTDAALMLGRIWRGHVRMIRDARGPVAFIIREGGTVQALFVHPRARRRGHGRALLAEAQADCPQLDLWTPTANTEARLFYAAHGFAEVAQGRGLGNDENLPDIHLIWRKEGAA